MKNNLIYKYINLLLRVVIAIAGLWFIYYKLKDHVFSLTAFSLNKQAIIYLITAFLLILPNWWLEAFKWRYTIKNSHKIDQKEALICTITGITASLITPNRLGEIPFRAMILDRDNYKELAVKTVVSSLSQVLVTILMGLLGIVFSLHLLESFVNINLIIIFIVLLGVVLLLFYFLSSKLNFLKKYKTAIAFTQFSQKQLMTMLMLSFIRYMVFTVQYFLILKAFGINMYLLHEFFLIPVCFLFSSLIPTILLSEIIVRGSIALLIFGLITNANTEIVYASILLWVMNIAFPALLGMFYLKRIKFFKEV